MQIKPFGEKAILLEFEQRIDPDINRQVRDWEYRIRAAALPGLSYFIPAYASLTVVFEQPLVDPKATLAHIKTLAQKEVPAGQQNTRYFSIPVCYEPEFAPDREAVMEQLSLDWTEIKALHTQPVYQVYMLGFSPGFAFMGTLPKYLQIPRKNTPRLKVPAQSVGIAGAQTGIYPDEIPGGWQLIGRTPIPPFRPLKDLPFLFQTGDQVQFRSISKEEFALTDAAIQENRFDWNSLKKKNL